MKAMIPHRLAPPILLAGVLVSPVRAQTKSLTLAEAVQRAERIDPGLTQAQSTIKTAGAAVRSQYGVFLPTLVATSQYNSFFSGGPDRINPVTNEVISGNTTATTVTFGGEARLNLTNGFQMFSNLSAAKAQRDQAEASFDQQRANVALQTTNTFLDALQAEDLVRVRAAAVERAEEQFRVALAKLQTRAGTVVDSLQAAITLGQAQLAVYEQQAQVASTQALLARAVGEEGRVEASADSSLFALYHIADTAALITEAAERSPQVIAAEAGLRAATSSLRGAKSSYLPLPSLSLSLGTTYRGPGDYQQLSNRGITLTGSWTLFDGFNRERQVSQASAQLENARATAADRHREAEAQMIGRIAALHAADQRLQLSQRVLEASRANLQVQLERYRLGTVRSEDVNLAQDKLNQAELDAVQARYAYVRAKAQIEAVLGRGIGG